MSTPTRKKARIEKLTKAQIDRMSEWRDRWIKIGLSTERGNFERAVDGIRRCYRASGLAEPGRIIAVRSSIVAVICGPLVEQILVKRQWPPVLGKRPGVASGVASGVRSGVASGVWSGVASGVESGVWSGVESGVASGVESGVRSGVWSGVWSGVESGVDGWADYLGGNMWAAWQSFQSFLREVCGLDLGDKLEEAAAAFQLVAENAGWWWPGTHVCYVSDRPTRLQVELVDGVNRLHSEDGPSIEWSDGYALWHLHGVAVPCHVVLKPESITIAEINAEKNAEVRRIMIERMGWTRYLSEAGARIIETRRDDIQATTESLMETTDGARVLVCACPSTARVYAMRVPREIASCQRAQQWLAGDRPIRIIGAS